ncbi:MAG: alpha/beta hydrolase [Mycolicibacterium sp.]|uniref:alpha/beta hydrolase n=1 Tax=Mycolicibacterium sp. TaxID=2320850 RepID=UPI003D13EAF4
MNALSAFDAASTRARRTFGDGTPHSGSTFDGSVKLRALSSEFAGAAPEGVWSGSATSAYTASSSRYLSAIGGVADLDARIAGLVDRSARIVGTGRDELDLLRGWVFAAAAGIPLGPHRETMLAQIVTRACAGLGTIIRAAHDDLAATGREIRAVGDGYREVTSLVFKETPGAPASVGPDDGAERRATDMSSGDIDQVDRANRAMLLDMLREYQLLPGGPAKIDRLADVTAIYQALAVPASRLVYLERPADPSQMIHAATAVGDPFTADHVSVTTPGVSGSTRETIVRMTAEAAELRAEATRVAELIGASPNIATVAWTGYQPPLNLGHLSVLSDDLARAGATELTKFLSDLDAATGNHPQSTALFGYSYGSLTTGIALQDGASNHVDNVVLYGSPGFKADTPADLGMNDGNFFVMSARDDPINAIGALAPYHGWGSDPNDIINCDGRLRFRFQHLETDAGVTPLTGYESKTGASGHSDYGRAAGASMTGYNLAAILLNRPDLAVRETPLSW